MKVIWKFEILHNQPIEMPVGAKILTLNTRRVDVRLGRV